jgi:hypothetical protein
MYLILRRLLLPVLVVAVLPLQPAVAINRCEKVFTESLWDLKSANLQDVKPGAGDLLPPEAIHPVELPFNKEQRKLLRNVV